MFRSRRIDLILDRVWRRILKNFCCGRSSVLREFWGDMGLFKGRVM